MVGVDGSSPFAPTKFGREVEHLAETSSAFFLAVPNKYQKVGLAMHLQRPAGPIRPRRVSSMGLSSRLFLLSSDEKVHPLAGMAFMRILRREKPPEFLTLPDTAFAGPASSWKW